MRSHISQLDIAATYINKNEDRIDLEKKFINGSIGELISFILKYSNVHCMPGPRKLFLSCVLLLLIVIMRKVQLAFTLYQT